MVEMLHSDNNFLLYLFSSIPPFLIQEVSISNDLLYQSEFVQKLQCNSYLNGTIQRYYSFNTSFQGLLSNKHNSEHCILYKMTGISGTNAFVGIVNETCDTITEFCPCSMVSVPERCRRRQFRAVFFLRLSSQLIFCWKTKTSFYGLHDGPGHRFIYSN